MIRGCGWSLAGDHPWCGLGAGETRVPLRAGVGLRRVVASRSDDGGRIPSGCGGLESMVSGGVATWWARRRSVVGLVVAGLLTLACGFGPSGSNSSRESDPPSSSAPSPSEQGGDRADGTTSVEEFTRDAKGAVALAERYWEARFRESGRRFVPVSQVVTYERAGEVSCGGEPLPRNNAVYCADGDFIAYDVRWAVGAFRQVGDAFLYFLLGHEYAHGVQARWGVRNEYTIQQELQADCLAGALLGDSVRAGTLILEEGDLDELREGLVAVGDDPGQPWFAEGSHGSPEERTDWFFRGYEKSVDICGLN